MVETTTRFPELDKSVATLDSNIQIPEQSMKTFIEDYGDMCKRSPFIIAGCSALIVIIMLLYLQPPFVCTTHNSKIDETVYHYELSVRRVIVWTFIIFTIVYFKNEFAIYSSTCSNIATMMQKGILNT